MKKKRCCRCKRDLPTADFNRDRSRGDGLQSRCRSCHLAANREWAERNPDVRRAAHRVDYERHGRRRSKDVSEEKTIAHRAVQRAVRNGSLVRPEVCPVCGQDDRKIHAHHEDYKKPLEIEWMCTLCHGRMHAGVAA